MWEEVYTSNNRVIALVQGAIVVNCGMAKSLVRRQCGASDLVIPQLIRELVQ